MFDVEPMAKARVLCTNKDLDAVVQALYEFGAIHVTRSKTFSPGAPSHALETVSKMLVKARAAESTLGLKNHGIPFTGNLVETESRFAAIPLSSLDALVSEKQELESRLSDLKNKERELATFKNLDLHLGRIQSQTQILEFALFETGDLQKTLAKAREFGQAIALGEGKSAKVLAAWDKRKADKARQALSAFAKEVSLPQCDLPSRDYAETRKQIAETQKRIYALNNELASFSAKHGSRIVSLRKALEREFKKAELPSKFGQTQMASCAEGWVAEKSFRELEKTLSERLDNRTLVEKVETREMPPTKLKNIFALRPFEFMVEFFSLPRYREIDPTFFTAITFPLFFGMILGDIGYGLILLLLGVYFMLKFKKGVFNSIGGMLALSAISTIVFGFIYAEIFGLEEVFGYHFTPLLSRVHEHGIEVLFALSVLIGFLHITLGLVLGAWQGVREKHYNHAYAKISWLAILFGFIAFLANSMHLIFTEYLQFLRIIPSPFDLGLFTAGIAGLVYFEGPVQLMEIPSLFSNVLSYLRIMALGLSGVALAGIVATIPLDFASLATLQPSAIVSFILFAIMLVLGHAVAIALGLLEAGIQSLRLHYVEFYSKFYKGGGTRFVPLRED
ncbi:MAG: V-type ATP synthase subunit I [Candidatus Norongarragalinales archaeon]